MKQKRIYFVLLAVAAVFAILAACGKGDVIDINDPAYEDDIANSKYDLENLINGCITKKADFQEACEDLDKVVVTPEPSSSSQKNPFDDDSSSSNNGNSDTSSSSGTSSTGGVSSSTGGGSSSSSGSSSSNGSTSSSSNNGGGGGSCIDPPGQGTPPNGRDTCIKVSGKCYKCNAARSDSDCANAWLWDGAQATDAHWFTEVTCY